MPDKSYTYKKCEQLLKLQSKLKSAEKNKISGKQNISLDEARKRLNEKYNNA